MRGANSIHRMRVLLAIALLSSPAMADPAPNSGSDTGTPTVSNSGNGATDPNSATERWQPYTPADLGGFSGIIIVPKPTQDALPHPRGMVIAPPETGDRMANALAVPGTCGLCSFWQQLEDGLGTLWRALQSPQS